MTESPAAAAPKQPAPPRALTIDDLKKMRARAEPIACLTCYDASFAQLEDRAGVDVVLIGDSLGMVIQGKGSTTGVTVDDIVYHGACVAPHLKRAFLMSDLPFLSYATLERALDASQRLMQQGGASMVKLEGGIEQAGIVEYLAARGVPVCAHIGLRPQFIHKLGAFKIQGRDEVQAAAMLADARALAEAGADVILVECVPNAVGQRLTAESPVPVIGIGAGPDVDGQILVLHDMLGISPLLPNGRRARFVKDYLSDGAAPSVEAAIAAYVREVKAKTYPAPEHTFG